jgi:hypothetical protein
VRRAGTGALPPVVFGRTAAKADQQQPGEPIAELELEALPGRRTIEVHHSADEGTVAQETFSAAAL